MKIKQFEISATTKLTKNQIDVCAMYLTMTGRKALIKDLMVVRQAKTPQQVIDLFVDHKYEDFAKEEFEQYRSDLARGMKSRITPCEAKPWFALLK